MAMLMALTALLTGANVLLLLAILYVYSKNFSGLKSGFTLALALFAALFLLQNMVSLYFYSTMMPYYTPEVELHVFVLTLLQTLAFAVLNWITWK